MSLQNVLRFLIIGSSHKEVQQDFRFHTNPEEAAQYASQILKKFGAQQDLDIILEDSTKISPEEMSFVAVALGENQKLNIEEIQRILNFPNLEDIIKALCDCDLEPKPKCCDRDFDTIIRNRNFKDFDNNTDFNNNFRNDSIKWIQDRESIISFWQFMQ